MGSLIRCKKHDSPNPRNGAVLRGELWMRIKLLNITGLDGNFAFLMRSALALAVTGTLFFSILTIINYAKLHICISLTAY